MTQKKTEYIVEFRNITNYPSAFYSRSIRGFKNKEVAMEAARSSKRSSPGLKVRVVEQVRRVLEVL